MSATLSTLLSLTAKAGVAAVIFNEVRGAVLAVPVLYAMYLSGGSNKVFPIIMGIAGKAMGIHPTGGRADSSAVGAHQRVRPGLQGMDGLRVVVRASTGTIRACQS